MGNGCPHSLCPVSFRKGTGFQIESKSSVILVFHLYFEMIEQASSGCAGG